MSGQQENDDDEPPEESAPMRTGPTTRQAEPSSGGSFTSLLPPSHGNNNSMRFELQHHDVPPTPIQMQAPFFDTERKISVEEVWTREVSSLPIMGIVPHERQPQKEDHQGQVSTREKSQHNFDDDDDDVVVVTTPSPSNTVIRTQEEVQKRFTPELESQNRVYRKSVSSYIRRVKNGEKIVNVDSGKPLKTSKHIDDTCYIVRGMHTNDYYFLTQTEFRDNYDESSGKPIDIGDDNDDDTDGAEDTDDDDKDKDKGSITKYEANFLHNDGYREYRSKRKVLGYEVKKKDMHWFHNNISREGETIAPAFFMAPWDEKTKVELGDYLVMTYPKQDNDSGIYRIGPDAFGQSYVELSTDGEFKRLVSLFRRVDIEKKKGSLWKRIRRSLKNLRGKDEREAFAKLQIVDDRTTRNKALHIAIQKNAPYDVLDTLFNAAPDVLDDEELKSFIGTYRQVDLERTAFHFACFRSTPSSVVAVTCNRLPQAATLEDNFGWTPLHFACKSKELNKETIEILAKAYPDGLIAKTKEKGLTPLILAIHHPEVDCDVIVTLTTEKVLKEEDKLGHLPLHHACVIGLPVDMIALLNKIYPDAISRTNKRGRTPFDCAIENVGESPHGGLAIIEYFATKYPFVLNTPNEKDETPLILAIERTRADKQYEVISLLATKKAVTLENSKGQLVRVLKHNLDPKNDLFQRLIQTRFFKKALHHACARALPEKILNLLHSKNSDAISQKDNRDRTPFEVALENVTKSPNGPATIKFLVGIDPNLVNTHCSNGEHVLIYFLRACTDCHDDDKNARLCEAFKYILNARPDICHIDFFKGLQNNLPPSLYEKAFEYTLEDQNLPQCRKHMRMDIFFTKFPPNLFHSIIKNSLKSNNEDSITWINKQCCKRKPVFFLMIQLYMHVTWIWLFAEASARYLTNANYDSYHNLAIALFSFALLFILLEIVQVISYQATSAMYYYLTDMWNLVDMVTIGLVLTSAYQLWMVGDPAEDPNERMTRILLWTGLFLFLELVSFLKKTFLPFAIFVCGTLKIFIKLIPFLVSTFLVLVAFSFMFFVDRYDSEDEDNQYSTLFNSFLTTFTAFVGGPEEAQNWLDVVFGIVTVIVLLNVVIAIVTSEWDNATRDASTIFWEYRLGFLREIKITEKAVTKAHGNPDPDGHVELKKLNASKDEPRFFAKATALIDSPDDSKFSTYVAQKLVFVIFFIAGLVSFGQLWPRAIRRRLFKAAVSDENWKEEGYPDKSVRDKIAALSNPTTTPEIRRSLLASLLEDLQDYDPNANPDPEPSSGLEGKQGHNKCQ